MDIQTLAEAVVKDVEEIKSITSDFVGLFHHYPPTSSAFLREVETIGERLVAFESEVAKVAGVVVPSAATDATAKPDAPQAQEPAPAAPVAEIVPAGTIVTLPDGSEVSFDNDVPAHVVTAMGGTPATTVPTPPAA